MKMKRTVPKESNPWQSLSTINSFDRGNMWPTRRLDEGSRTSKNQKMIFYPQTTSFVIGSLINQLCSVLETDQNRREQLYFTLCRNLHKMNFIDSSYSFTEFEVIRAKYTEAVFNLLKIAQSTIGNEVAIAIPRPLNIQNHKYKEEFEELDFIAKGGFGYVFKAVHKLDEVEYAIKKIFVQPNKMKSIKKHLEEVKTIAKLNHPNIVPYKQAWIEPMSSISFQALPPSKSESSSDSSTNNQREVRTSGEFSGSHNLKYNNLKIVEHIGQNSSSQEKSRSKSNAKESSFSVSFRESLGNENNDNSIKESTSKTTSEETSNDDSRENKRLIKYKAKDKNKYKILYIQMALCEKTLRTWLNERTEPILTSTIAEIASQILQGLDYIHTKHIVHHDIKPNNIFISFNENIRIQLGDFGLACPKNKKNGHDEVFGTHMYAAPEQLKGQCNKKSDIYSLGVVMIELLVKTTMECSKIIQVFQKNEVPNYLAKSHPEWIEIIMKLIKTNPDDRPTTKQLLQDLKTDKDLTINRLQQENEKLKHENQLQYQMIQSLKEKQGENEKLKRQNQLQNQEIQSLKEKLAQLTVEKNLDT